MSHPVVWFEVMGKNGSELAAFYGELFDWKIDTNNPMKYGMVDTKSKEGIPGGVGQTPEGGSVYATFYVHSDDVQASLDRATKLGGKTILGPTALPEVEIAMFEDPAGNHVGIVRPRAK